MLITSPSMSLQGAPRQGQHWGSLKPTDPHLKPRHLKMLTKNIQKYPSARNSGTPRKHPQNTKKKQPKRAFFGFLGLFFECLRGNLGAVLGVLIFRPFLDIFLEGYFLWKFRVGPSRGSAAGRGVLKSRQRFPCLDIAFVVELPEEEH